MPGFRMLYTLRARAMRSLTQSHSGDSAMDQLPETAHCIAQQRLDICRRLMREERVFERIMGRRFQGNACRIMVLDLFLAEGEGRASHIWEVCNALSIPPSTAHRKLDEMIRAGLVDRMGAQADRRRTRVQLASTTSTMISQVLDRIHDIARAAGSQTARR